VRNLVASSRNILLVGPNGEPKARNDRWVLAALSVSPSASPSTRDGARGHVGDMSRWAYENASLSRVSITISLDRISGGS
jgi:hypothetical protein